LNRANLVKHRLGELFGYLLLVAADANPHRAALAEPVPRNGKVIWQHETMHELAVRTWVRL
jgi:hypothetical protein